MEENYSVKTLDQADAAMGLLATLTVQLDHEVNLQNVKLLEARKHDQTISALQKRIERYREALRDWAQAQRGTWEGKSFRLRQGTIGFRLIKPAIDFLEGWDEAQVLAKLRGIKPWKVYIRLKESLNKTLILNDVRPEVARLQPKDLRRIGLAVKQGESFYAEPANIEGVTP